MIVSYTGSHVWVCGVGVGAGVGVLDAGVEDGLGVAAGCVGVELPLPPLPVLAPALPPVPALEPELPRLPALVLEPELP